MCVGKPVHHRLPAKPLNWTDGGLMLIKPWRTNENTTMFIQKLHFKIPSSKWPFGLGLIVRRFGWFQENVLAAIFKTAWSMTKLWRHSKCFDIASAYIDLLTHVVSKVIQPCHFYRLWSRSCWSGVTFFQNVQRNHAKSHGISIPTWRNNNITRQNPELPRHVLECVRDENIYIIKINTLEITAVSPVGLTQ